MRAYADEITAHAAGLAESDAQAAREWADWIRQHAENTDPLNGPPRLEEVASCSHEELQPHMHGWSTYGPHRYQACMARSSATRPQISHRSTRSHPPARRAALSGRCSYTGCMSAMREELHHLVDELPEAEVRPVLELIRGRADASHGVRDLPFFASFESDPDLAEKSEEILRAELGR
jgi:hypothetical protein